MTHPESLQAPVVLDIAGTALNGDDRRRIAHPLTGGLILFARNFESRLQLTELTASIKKLRPDLLICVDHEGGRVQRFRTDGFTHLPPMRALGELWMKDALAATDAATAAGHVLGAELRACEILNAPSGKPEIRLSGALAEWFAAQGLVAQVTLSDETDYAVSFVVVEQDEQR